MTAPHEVNTNALLAYAEEALLTISALQQLIDEAELDAVQWFFLSVFLSDVDGHAALMRGVLERTRPSEEVQVMLAESYRGFIPTLDS